MRHIFTFSRENKQLTGLSKWNKTKWMECRPNQANSIFGQKLYTQFFVNFLFCFVFHPIQLYEKKEDVLIQHWKQIETVVYVAKAWIVRKNGFSMAIWPICNYRNPLLYWNKFDWLVFHLISCLLNAL